MGTPAVVESGAYGVEIEERVVAVLDLAVLHYSADQQRCGMCKEILGEHLSTCPVPALEDWLFSQ